MTDNNEKIQRNTKKNAVNNGKEKRTKSKRKTRYRKEMTNEATVVLGYYELHNSWQHHNEVTSPEAAATEQMK